MLLSGILLLSTLTQKSQEGISSIFIPIRNIAYILEHIQGLMSSLSYNLLLRVGLTAEAIR